MPVIRAQTDCVINYLKYKNYDSVQEGEEIMQVEVMKMMIPIVSPITGTIKYHVQKGDYAYAGTTLAEVI
jgi:biotin carboxyl carrier protein